MHTSATTTLRLLRRHHVAITSPSRRHHIIALAGSLLRGGYSRALLHKAQELAPVGLRINRFDLAGLPFFNAHVKAAGLPPPVADAGSQRDCERIRFQDATVKFGRQLNGTTESYGSGARSPCAPPAARTAVWGGERLKKLRWSAPTVGTPPLRITHPDEGAGQTPSPASKSRL